MIQLTQRLAILCFLFLSGHILLSQSLESYNQQRLNRNKVGMIILGSWAVGNIVSSPVLKRNVSGSDQYFHDMNLYWNLVNFGIAGFGLYAALTTDPASFDIGKSLAEQHKIEKILLFNTALDVGYIMGGLYLRERGINRGKDRLKGFGKSIVLQGAFLFAFDLIFYLSHTSGQKELMPLLNGLSVSANGVGYIWTF